MGVMTLQKRIYDGAKGKESGMNGNKEITGKDTEIIHVPFQGDEHSINKRNFIADSTKFKKITGWYPQISFEEGLKKTILFYSQLSE